MVFIPSFIVMSINNLIWSSYLLFVVYRWLKTVMVWLGLVAILIMGGLFLVTDGVRWLSSLWRGIGKNCLLRRFIVVAWNGGIWLFFVMEVIRM